MDLVEAGEVGLDLVTPVVVIIVGHGQGNDEPAAKDGHEGRKRPDRVSHWVFLLVKAPFGGQTVKTPLVE
jgi:hypothetical protein